MVGLIASGAMVAMTFLPDPLIVPAWLRAPLFVGVFPLHLGTVVMLQQARSRSPIDLFRALPIGMRVFLGAFVLAMWLVFMTSMFGPVGLSGEPERHDSRYYSSYQGELTEISHDQYVELQAVSQRRFNAIPAAFYAIGVAAALTYPRLVDRRPPPPVPYRPPPPAQPVPGNPYLDPPH